MNTLIWVALIAAIPPTLAVFFSDRKQSRNSSRNSRKIDAVHDIANSRLTKALERIEALNLVVERLEVQIKEMKS